MARAKNVVKKPGDPSVPPNKGVEFLSVLVGKAQELLANRPISSDAKQQWELLARNYLEKAFGVNSPNVDSVLDVGRYGIYPLDAPESYWEKERAEKLTTQVKLIEGLTELLKTEIELEEGGVVQPLIKREEPGHRIFLVHGTNAALAEQVARFLEKLQQKVIILREQPDKGRTIIEKFENYSDVGFAVVLLTGDDIGGESRDGKDKKPRARQNVILELGYFLGRLGRSRVCALYQTGVEIPSDYKGVLYVPFDDTGGWKLNIAKELKAAGLPVNMNDAI